MGSHHHAGLYHMKARDSMHWGPHAILIRDHALIPEKIGDHAYLEVPEIVEDICICLSEQHNFDLLEAFMRTTKPAIVKFSDQPRSDCLATAVYHLYNAFRGYGCCRECNTCFDGEGVPVPKERILNVEFLN